ncbi:MAG TPA: AMP-binding protein, partial [Terriglobales bacterium]|nr:AMP-binding protein [Terriglobales bacterium]
MATFYDLFVQNAERYPSNIALEIQRGERTESYSYADARKMAEAVGRWLLENRFEPGTRVMILADNHPRWVTTYLGIIAAGCVAVPLDTAFHADQVAKLMKDSGAALVFCDRKHLKLLQEASQGMAVGIVLTDGKPEGQQQLKGDLDSMFAAASGGFNPVAAEPDAIVGLLYTSGTTADPKGVMLTHANMLGEVDAVLGWVKLGPEDALLGVLPLFHVLSQMANILMPL